MRTDAIEAQLLRDLKEAIAIVEGRPTRSPFVAVEEWKDTVRRAEVSDE
jgi:hypothetical protein